MTNTELRRLTNAELGRAYSQADIDAAVTVLRGNGAEGITAAMVAAAITEGRRLHPESMSQLRALARLHGTAVLMAALRDIEAELVAEFEVEAKAKLETANRTETERGIARLVELHHNMGGGDTGEARVDSFQAYDELGEILDILTENR